MSRVSEASTSSEVRPPPSDVSSASKRKKDDSLAARFSNNTKDDWLEMGLESIYSGDKLLQLRCAFCY